MENPDTPQTHSSISDFHEYHSNTHRHPPDIPQTPQDISREVKMSTDENRRQQTPPDTLRHWQVLFEYDWRCLLARVVVCWHLEFLGHVWGVSGGCLGGVYGYLSDIHGNLRCSNVFGGYLGSPSLQYGAVTLLWHSPERHNFFHLTILRHQNIKMSIYKGDKNHWVMQLFSFLVPSKRY